jgi:hypothetical protein
VPGIIKKEIHTKDCIPHMKKLLLTAALVAVSSVGLHADLPRNVGSLTTLAGWDFNQGTASTVSSINARYSQSQAAGPSVNTYFVAGVISSPGSAAFGTVYFNGSNGGTFASPRVLASSNAPSYDLLSVDGLSSSNNSLGDIATNVRSVLLSSNSVLDNGRASFKFETTSDFNVFEGINLAYSARNQGTDFATISWSYSLDGVSFTSVANTSSQINVSGALYSVFTADLSTITALNGAGTVWLGMDYLENSAGASVFIDNVAIYGTAAVIPEPSTYAAILGALTLGFVAIRRRFQAQAV